MAKVKTTVDVVFVPRVQKRGKIIIEMLRPTLEDNNYYTVVINDYVEYLDSYIDNDGQTIEYMRMELLETKRLSKSKEVIDLLFTIPQLEINLDDSFTEQMSLIESQVLLYFIQNDLLPNDPTKTIYGVLPEEWVII